MSKKRPYKLGIALGGGGAKGISHIGVLNEMRAAGIEFDVVTGTSIGALVGAVYAAGNLQVLEYTARTLTLKEIPMLLSPAWSKKGFFSGKSAFELLNDLIAVERIEDLPITFAAVSSDLRSGEVQIYTEGNIHDAVRASVSIPAVFTPVFEGDRVLVDGGLLEPVPVELCRSLGADVVIAVDLFGPVRSDRELSEGEKKAKKAVWPSGITPALNYIKSISEKLQLPEWFGGTENSTQRAINIIDVVEGTLALSQRLLTEYRLKEHPPDILIQPAVSHVGLLDFHRANPVIDLGAEVAQEAMPQIQALLQSLEK